VTESTPGQVAYEAYLRHWNIPGLRTWHEEPRGQQRAWEEAAQAAITAWWQAHEAVICGEEEHEETP